jgi:hypothetical protein
MNVSELQRSVRRRDVLKALGIVPAAWMVWGKHDTSPPPVVFCCSAANDLYKLLSSSAKSFPRYDAPEQAVAHAAHGSGVLILADGYPDKTTQLDSEVFQLAVKRKQRLYVEYPSFLPDLQVGEPRGIAKGRYSNLLERVFVASDAFNPALEKLAIMDFHDGKYVPVEFADADLVLARAAGFDKAIFGLPETGVKPILFRISGGDILVGTTKLSQFITGRYAPTKSWGHVWNWILSSLAPATPLTVGEYKATVHPSFSSGQPLPENAGLIAFQKGVEWYSRAKLFGDSPGKKNAIVGEAPGHALPAPGQGSSGGDGREGVFEGFSNTIEYDGSQSVGRATRNDCAGETSLAMACSSVLSGKPHDGEIAANLNDFIYSYSDLVKGPRNDPASPSFGLVGWSTPGSTGTYYGDDNARSLLGTIGASAVLKSDRWDEQVLRCILGNLRTTGKQGFRGNSLQEAKLQANGWKFYRDADTVNYAPHFEAYPWACYLWAFDKTHDARFLDRTKNAIRMTLDAYPDQWKWTNGIQQERARMLLPLAWLVRVEDTAEHRQWLRHMVEILISFQDACGALREEIGPGRSHYGPPASNDRYGTNEASLIQQNGDPACDLLYTSNFAFLGLHEAGAATGDATYLQAENKLAEFLCRIQASSIAHPEFDGAWFRGFDYKIWDYWASNSDWGWGVWSTETGWTQAWITSVLAMRHMKTSLWDLSAKSQIAKYMDKLLPVMMPEGGTQ